MTSTRFSTTRAVYVAAVRQQIDPDKALTLPGNRLESMTSSADIRLLADGILSVVLLDDVRGLLRLTPDRQLVPVEVRAAVDETIPAPTGEGSSEITLGASAEITEEEPIVVEDAHEPVLTTDKPEQEATTETVIEAPAAPAEPEVVAETVPELVETAPVVEAPAEPEAPAVDTQAEVEK